jgi:inhibitor of KinA sporulation pathway (predicted exonuclease)
MGKRLDQILVVDVEATCWDSAPPEGQASEIIEIGVCVLDVPSGASVRKHSILVRPEVSTVSRFCTQLTTLTPDQVQDGVTFDHACAVLRREYAGRHRVWASYGDYDRRQFEKQCRERAIQYPFGPTHINVKNLFALTYGLPREIGLKRALVLAGLALEGVHHRGVDDAWNTAQLLAMLLLRARHGHQQGGNGRHTAQD